MDVHCGIRCVWICVTLVPDTKKSSQRWGKGEKTKIEMTVINTKRKVLFDLNV